MSADAGTSGRTILPVADTRAVRAAIGRPLRGRRGVLALGLLALVGSAAAGTLVPPLLGRIVDVVVGRQGADAVTDPVLGLVGAALAQGLLAVVGMAAIARVGEQVLAALRERFVARALGLPLARLEQAGAGDLTSRVTSDLALVGDAVRQAVPDMARGALVIVLSLGGLALLDWRFFVAALVAVPVQVLTARWYVRRSSPLYREQREVGGAQQQQLLDTAGGIATVRALDLHDDHGDRVRSRAADVVDLALRVVRLQTGFFGRLNLAEFLGVAAVLATGFALVGAGTATVGTASAAALYFINLFTPINEVLFLLDTLQSAGASLARVVGVVDRDEDTEDTDDADGHDRSASPDGGVRVRGVSHAYTTGHEVLSGVDLDLAPGERLALVGASGAGKTTLATIVAGVHRASAGRVEVGDVAMVSQEVHVFAGTVAEDLRLAAPGATDEDLWAALDVVDARGWVAGLPEGLRTVVGTGGHTLTAAQAQQLALARLVLADPAVAVLDEATAEAGSAGARILEAAADHSLRGRTALVVAHRLSQAAAADRVAVLDAGVVVEHGTHDELLAAGGRYAELWAAGVGRVASGR
ncbi:multidrug ABC transporter permease [Actinomycetospora sp. NBRC 106375]|uniref:ABC transporter ATP-binding protein n=1 Tax=Actinomycetospora sp. NBRC 106375 TaxID=3032207 RepID=UPI0024A5756B|nr:ABC transporter ATP-binding protein [Actinomycetospora sp. NBRC 106375]GLZ47942.1 multidrug ABC transporter permease [Actinomycetospora sp. NBRC 106375]